jgi:hypothetical protein
MRCTHSHSPRTGWNHAWTQDASVSGSIHDHAEQPRPPQQVMPRGRQQAALSLALFGPLERRATGSPWRYSTAKVMT